MRSLLVALVGMTLVVGCSSKAQVTLPAPEPVAAPVTEPNPAPPPVTMKPACLADGAGAPSIRAYGRFDERWTREAPGRCTKVIDPGPLTVFVEVDAPTHEEAVKAVRITGATQTREPTGEPYSAGRRLVVFYLDGGKVLDQIEVAVLGLVAYLNREPSHALRFSWETPQGTWADLTPGESLPPGPVTLRVQVMGGSLASPGMVSLRAFTWDELKPSAIEAVTPDTLLLRIDQPPQLVQIHAADVMTDQGLRLTGSTHFYVGAAPQLQAVNPATGKAERLGEAPVEIYQGALSPNGQYAGLVTMVPDSISEITVQVMDLQDGRKLRQTGLRFDLLHPRIAFDRRGRLVIPDLERLIFVDPATGTTEPLNTPGIMWASVSPDGGHVAGYRGTRPALGKTGAWMPPAAISEVVLYDLTANRQVSYPAKGYVVPWPGLAWLPDGRLALSISSSNQPGLEKHITRTVIDHATGSSTALEGEFPAPPIRWEGNTLRLGALPDGRSLQVFWENAHYMRHPLP